MRRLVKKLQYVGVLNSCTSFQITQEHCLHCGNCFEKCPVGAVKRRGIQNGTE